jgi:cytochrome P450
MSTVTDQDLLSPELTADPHAYYAELRASDPVHWAPASRAWLLTRYDDVVAAFGDPRLSSDRVRPLLGVLPAERRAEYGPMLEIISRWMVVTDPPAHTWLNRLASHAFRQQRVSAMSGWIGELVDELLDNFVAAGGDDFLAGLAYPLPAAVIARMMGVPQQDRGKFQHWSDELALVAFGAGGQDRAGRHARALAGVRELQEYLAELIARRRREPGEDMISVLLRGVDEDGDHLDEAELMASGQAAARRLRPRGARLPGRAAGPHRGQGRAAQDPGPARGHPRPGRRDLAAEHRVPRRHRAEDRLCLR